MRLAGTWAICILAVTTAVVSLPTQAKARIPDHVPSGFPRAGGENTGAIRVPEEIPDFATVESVVAATDPKMTIYRTEPPENFEIGLRLALTSDVAEGDVALRLLTPRDYYVVHVDGREGRISFSRVIEGRSYQVASAERPLGANAWHSLRVRAQGNRFTVTLDDDWLFTAYDATLQRPGPLAVWTATGGAVRFDGIAVTPLAPE